jgi:mono/diheme cytochrome c family protein
LSRRGAVTTVALALLLAAIWPAAPAVRGHDPKDGDEKGDASGEPVHVHAPVPAEYRSAHVPSAAWTDRRMIDRGREIYITHCAVCHGEEGRGDGPAVQGLPVKPPDLRDPGMVAEMAGNYWFWRISEGAFVEPFRSQGSIMPAWKDQLSVEDRWAVIAYQHTFSGHRGPHVTSEHPQMMSPAHASHGGSAAPAGAASGGAPGSPPAAGTPGAAPASSGAHKH